MNLIRLILRQGLAAVIVCASLGVAAADVTILKSK